MENRLNQYTNISKSEIVWVDFVFDIDNKIFGDLIFSKKYLAWKEGSVWKMFPTKRFDNCNIIAELENIDKINFVRYKWIKHKHLFQFYVTNDDKPIFQCETIYAYDLVKKIEPLGIKIVGIENINKFTLFLISKWPVLWAIFLFCILSITMYIKVHFGDVAALVYFGVTLVILKILSIFHHIFQNNSD